MLTRTQPNLRRRAAMTVAMAGLAVPTASTPAFGASAGAPSFATAEQIQSVAAAVKHPVYWLGPRAGFSYELTVAASGRIYIRYLPKSAKLGDKRAIFKTVATYPVKGALANLRAGAKFLKRPVLKVGADGFALVSKPPTSVYLVFGTNDYQVEVFTPSAKLSKSAITSVKPI